MYAYVHLPKSQTRGMYHMSASDKKKIRKEQALTERQRQEQAEAKKLKIYTITFVASLVLIVLIAATVLGVRAYTQSGITEKSTVAAVIGDKKMNAVEFSYYFNDAIDEYYNGMYEQFSTYTDSYLQAVGLDLSKPLDEQQYEEGKTWADYFVETALSNAKSDYALSEEAAKQNFKLFQLINTAYLISSVYIRRHKSERTYSHTSSAADTVTGFFRIVMIIHRQQPRPDGYR